MGILISAPELLENYHGTHTAGISASRTNNISGVSSLSLES